MAQLTLKFAGNGSIIIQKLISGAPNNNPGWQNVTEKNTDYVYTMEVGAYYRLIRGNTSSTLVSECKTRPGYTTVCLTSEQMVQTYPYATDTIIEFAEFEGEIEIVTSWSSGIDITQLYGIAAITTLAIAYLVYTKK